MNDQKLDKIDEKLDNLDTRLDVIDKHLAVYNSQLEIHIKRTELLEIELKPVKAHVHQMKGAAKLIGILSVLAPIIAVIQQLITK